jgi:hypothetical protein
MKTSTHIRAGSAIAMAIILVSATSPAGASMQPRLPRSTSISALGSGNCPLDRVGTQYVRCDNLTGAGVSAPSWVPELEGSVVTSPQWPAHGATH